MSPAKRRTLAGLNSGPSGVPEMPAPPHPKAPPPGVPDSRPVQAAQSLSREVPDSRTSEAGSPEVPKYLQLERKDVLLWPRQLHELTVLRRVLNRRRGRGVGERITENTLVRVAVDYLIAHAGELKGTTEDELRNSLGI
jgi:hypothetical protein